MTFWEQLTKICAEKDISPSKLCKEIGLSNATATHWKKGSMPTTTSLYKVCNYLHITPRAFNYDTMNKKEFTNDTEQKTPLKKTGKSMFYDNIITLCIRDKISLEKLMAENEISEEEIHLIKDRKLTTERQKNIENKLAEYFNISKTELTSGTIYEEYNIYIQKAYEEYELLIAYENAPDYIKKAIKKLLELEI